MATFTLYLLGSFIAEKEAESIRFGYDKMRALLAYLAIERERPHRRQRLAALLWPDHDKRAALGNLSQALYQLRRTVGDRDDDRPLLNIDAQTLQLNPDVDIWIDAVEFTALLDANDAHAHASLAACGDCLARLQQAVDLYRGIFLEGIAVDDSAEFDEWLLMQRERFHRQAGEALRLLAEGFEHRGQEDAALGYAKHRLDLEPWQEESHRQIMRLHLAAGDRTAALAQYEECRRVLAAELAVEPAAETTALYRRIRYPDDAGANAGNGRGLPTPLTPLIGRADELAELNARLADPGCRFITLTGPGGSGKTRLAIEAAAQSALHFAHGVIFVSMVSVDRADAVAETLAQALDLSLAGHEAPRARVIDYLRRRELLLLLDNFEHLIDSQPLVADILRAAPKVKVLITSRVRLNAPAEQVIVVPGLPIPQPSTKVAFEERSILADYGAVSLFLHHVRREHSDYIPDSASLDAIIHICRTISGMPLGIMLAAGWMDVLSPVEIATRLTGETGDAETAGIDLLETDSSGFPERQRSMRAVFDHAWSLLPASEQRVLAALSVFRGGFTYDAAHSVARATLRQLKRFVHKSLAQRSVDGRYELHELLRQYAAEQLDEQADEADAVNDHHATFFAGVSQGRGNSLRGKDQLTAIRAMNADADNLRVAWAWSVERGQAALVERAVDGLCSFYDWHGYLQMGDRACGLAQSQFNRPDAFDVKQTYARLLTWHARFRRLLGYVQDAGALLDCALTALDGQDQDDTETLVAHAAILGERSALVKDVDRVTSDHLRAQSLALHRKAGNRQGMMIALHRRGELAADTSDYESAHELLDEGLTLGRSLGDKRRIAAILHTLANVYALQGMLEQAEYVGRQAIVINEELGDRLNAYIGITELAKRVCYIGRFEHALQLLEDACTVFEELGALRPFAFAKHLVGWMHLNLGDIAGAEAAYSQAAGAFQELGDRHGQALTCLGGGEAILMRGQFGRACASLAQGVALFRSLEQWDEYAITLSGLALAQRAMGDRGHAQQSALEALQTVRRIGAFAPAHMAIDADALLLADAGEVERAIEYHALVMAHPYFSNSEFRKTVTGKVIDECAAALPLEQTQAAEERGRCRDIWVTVDEILAEAA